MNKRITELAEQAGLQLGTVLENYTTPVKTITLEHRKFAELIVRECISLMDKQQEYCADPGPYESREYYERMMAKEGAFDEASRIIKYHFGVEE